MTLEQAVIWLKTPKYNLDNSQRQSEPTFMLHGLPSAYANQAIGQKVFCHLNLLFVYADGGFKLFSFISRYVKKTLSLPVL